MQNVKTGNYIKILISETQTKIKHIVSAAGMVPFYCLLIKSSVSITLSAARLCVQRLLLLYTFKNSVDSTFSSYFGIQCNTAGNINSHNEELIRKT